MRFDSSWQLYLGVIWFSALWLIVALRIPGYWRRPDPRFVGIPVFWVWGEPLWRGFVRAMPTILIGVGLMIAMSLYLLIAGPAGIRAEVFWVWFAGFLAALCLWGTIALFNQPKFLVPPYLRSEHGAVSGWHRGQGPHGKPNRPDG